MERILIGETPKHTEKSILVKGWVNGTRDHGKLIFVDLRDRSGLLQVVAGPWNQEAYQVLKEVGNEFVLTIRGKVVLRPENLINPDIATGTIEFQAEKVEILNTSAVTPFEINHDTLAVEEELRLQYRYLDLRSERLRKNLRKRARMIAYFRSFLDQQGFTEIETPILTVSSPEGARDFIVPSRLGKGLFYALPQSPQQYKQLLMVAGVERYYQIAKCLRDEDTRLDRQAEHTQLDIEVSFMSQPEIEALVEELLTTMVRDLYPEKRITRTPWPRLSYREAMDTYGTDKPDLRQDKSNPDELAFAWIVDFPLFEYNQKQKRIEPMHHMFSMPREEDLSLLDSDPLKVIGQLYDIVCNGYEMASGSIRIIKPEIQEKVFQIIGLRPEEAQRRFGHMLEAFRYGAPPHGGIAPGIDRLLMVLEKEPNIREVIAFPKTGEGRDPMMGAPSSVKPEQLKDLGIEITS